MVPFWPRRRITPPKTETYYEVLAYFSVAQREVLDGYGEMSILKVFGINIAFCNDNWAPGNASMSWAFACAAPLQIAPCIVASGPLFPAKKNPLPLKLHEAANRV